MSTEARSPIADYRHLYVHVPFCARRCSYCDFSIAVRRVVPTDQFVRGIGAEFSARNIGGSPLTLDTVYLGGGTPSRLGGHGVAALLDLLRAHASWSASAEVTIEANPEDITPAAVAQWREAGVNRLSIGVQTLDDRVLRWMHRVHDAAAAVRAVQIARDGGIAALSLDLIFSVPDALQRDWVRDVDALLALSPQHISLYGLTIETHTPLGHWRERGEVVEGPDERYETEFLEAHTRLAAAGFEHYEVSNFARHGHRAVHNSAYWTGAAYLGVGPSAHGFDGVDRRWNAASWPVWQRAVEAGTDPVEGSETLDENNRIAETVYLGLRTVDGLVVTDRDLALTTRWVEAGWLEWIADTGNRRVRCTPMGWLRLDRLAADLTALRSRS